MADRAVSPPPEASDGALTQLAPVAIRYWDEDELRRDAAARQSRTTHGAPEAVDACVAFADILADAIAGSPRSEVLRPRHGEQPFEESIADILTGSWRGRRRSEILSSGYVVHSLKAAIWCVARTGSFPEALLLTANLGQDADTVAAITGQLAGALHGYQAIPNEWLAQLTSRGMIFGMARQLVERSAAGRNSE